MSARDRLISSRAGAPIWGYIFVAIGVVLGLGVGIATYDTRGAVNDRRSEELRRLRSHAERTAAQIESQISDEGPEATLESVCHAPWLSNYWRRNIPRQPGRLYAAVTDRRSLVIAHTSPNREGRLARPFPLLSDDDNLDWENESFGDLATIRDAVLTGGRESIDIRMPIRFDGEILGLYHAGMDAEWLNSTLAEERRVRVVFWVGLIGGMCCVVLVTSLSIVRVTRQTAQLEHELDVANARRLTEMHELVLGVAHEIRNPLNAIRLNLHTIDQVVRGNAELPSNEIDVMLAETTSEIARLEVLMREMLGFARESGQSAEPIDLAGEVQRTIGFLRHKLEEGGITINVDAATTGRIAMHRQRLRQVLLNLLNNSCEALEGGGQIGISIRPQRDRVELIVDDNGPGIPLGERERVFVPFHSTKPAGTGLGLALARKHIEEAGGSIVCDTGPGSRGCRFRIVLPALTNTIEEAVT